MDTMGLEVMSYFNRTTGLDGEGRTYWIPEHIAGADGAFILWRYATDPKNNYKLDGWFPQIGPHIHGGFHSSITSALAWIQRARDVRDGKVKDFRGV
jgi:hypothetical protein